jgi:hypothetical protein
MHKLAFVVPFVKMFKRLFSSFLLTVFRCQRVYRFYSWESELSTGHDYPYIDVSISDYLKRLDEYGVNINDYRSIYHYF